MDCDVQFPQKPLVKSVEGFNHGTALFFDLRILLLGWGKAFGAIWEGL